MAVFATTQTQALGATSIPMRRRVPRQPDYSPAWTTPLSQPTPTPTARSYIPQAWPVAPEAPPLFTPPFTGTLPTAPVVSPGWNPDVQIPEAPPTYPASLFGIAETQPATGPLPYAQQAYAPSSAPLKPPIDFASMREAPRMLEADMEVWLPPDQRTSKLPLVALLVVVVGACLWILRDDLFPPLVVEIPVSKPAGTAQQSPPALLATPPSPSRAMTGSTEPAPEVRRAEVIKPKIDLVAASDAGQKLFLDLIAAKTPEARAALIAVPEEHGADVEEFFAAGGIELLAFKPSNATPLTLPGQDPVPLFQVTTKANSHGALLRVLPQPDGSFRLDWPLFAETHQRKLGGFLEKKPVEPAWFYLGLRRSHGLELPQASREIHVAFKLQGSADGSLSCVAVAQKDTPIGRYLARETDWTDIYITRLLLQHRRLADGTDSIVILDCEGAAKADLQ